MPSQIFADFFTKISQRITGGIPKEVLRRISKVIPEGILEEIDFKQILKNNFVGNPKKNLDVSLEN